MTPAANQAPTVSERPTPFDISRFKEEWLQHLSGYGKRSPLTVKAYRADLHRFARFLHEHRLPTSVEEISHRHVRAFAASLSGKAPATVGRNLDALSSFFTHLVSTGVVTTNPVALVQRPKRPRKLPRSATLEQCQALMGVASTARDRAMLLLLLGCGLRRAELLGIDVGDLAADLSELRVTGKGDRQRLLPVPTQVRPALHTHLQQREANGPALFTNRVGSRIGTTTFQRLSRRLLMAADLDDSGLSAHNLRHSCATELLKAQADLETIRDLMGHSDISVTGRYLSTDPSRKRTAVESLRWGGGSQ